jgi:hypothetical protein
VEPVFGRGEPDVRLSERKIRYLSDRIVSWMEKRGDVEFLDRPDVVALAVARAVTQELKQRKDDLDDEVEGSSRTT